MPTREDRDALADLLEFLSKEGMIRLVDLSSIDVHKADLVAEEALKTFRVIRLRHAT